MPKDIAVHLPLNETSFGVVDYAISLAETFGAHAEAIAFVYQPVVTAMAYGAIPADVVAWQQQEGQKSAEAALKRFTASAQRAGISFGARTFSAVAGASGEMFGEMARRYDLAVVAQPDPEKPSYDDIAVEAALFGSGRPTLVVPYIHKGGSGFERAVVCWDGSRTAARAIGDALPFLKRAKSIDLLIVADERIKSDDVPGADMGQHLARHGLPVEVRRVNAGGLSVADTILSYIADRDADFMVMGGYGHSRLREFVLGGVTRGLIAAMTVPALMSH